MPPRSASWPARTRSSSSRTGSQTNIGGLEGALIRVTAFAGLNRQQVDLALAAIVLVLGPTPGSMTTYGPGSGILGRVSALSPGLRHRTKLQKAVNVALFCVTLVLAVVVALLVLARFAGGWGIPYFSTTTERGSRCVNTFTGFDCPSVTLADVGFFGDVELPPDTRVVGAHYRSTHDYQLQAELELPPASAAAGLAALKDSYGSCVRNHPSPLVEPGLTSLCILANDQDTTETGTPDSRVYVVATALRADETRVVDLSVRSR